MIPNPESSIDQKTPFQIRNEKSCKMFTNHDSGISNIHTYVGKKYAIYKNLIPICDLKGHIYTNKGITFNVNDFTQILYTKVKFIANLQEMSTLFREMSVSQVCTVHSIFHVCSKYSSSC